MQGQNGILLLGAGILKEQFALLKLKFDRFSRAMIQGSSVERDNEVSLAA
jgi:hypothetical protein